MAVIVEDGSIVTDADSLVTRAEYIAYAGLVGTTIANAAAADEELIGAMRFIDSLEPQFYGELVERDQALSFPRTGLYLEGWSWTHEEIPERLKQAQMEVALYIHAGYDPYNPEQTMVYLSESVDGAVAVSYAAAPPSNPTEHERWKLLLSIFCVGSEAVRLVRA